MSIIADNIATLQSQIKTVCLACGHDPREVTLLAVSKTQPISAIAEAMQAGLMAFGENQVQEALPKIQHFRSIPTSIENNEPLLISEIQSGPRVKHGVTDESREVTSAIEWHFIGPLQRNKTKLVAQYFDWVHSVDRLLLAQRLSEQRPDHLPPLNVCIQVNVDNEPQKHGVTLAELPELATAIARLPRLRLRGLMTIPKATADHEQQRRCFAALRQAQEQLSMPLDTLSMGMSNDFAAAIAEGATIIRIGSAIFGTRN